MNEFWKWIKGEKVLFTAQITVWFTTLAALLEFCAHLSETAHYISEPDSIVFRTYLININYYIQVILIIFVILFFNFFHQNRNVITTRVSKYYERLNKESLSESFTNTLKKNSNRNMNMFLKWWKIFWWALLGIYTLELLSGLHIVAQFKSSLFQHNQEELLIFFIAVKRIFEIFNNNIGAVALFICFLIIHSPIRSRNSFFNDSIDLKDQLSWLKENIVRLFFYLFILTLFHLLAIMFIGTSNISYSAMVIKIEKVDGVFRLISGVINCVFLSLLVGRLDSKFIHTPSFLISILYIYAAVQIGFLFFNDDRVKVYVLYLALFFKFYLFLILTFIIRTCRLSDMFMIFPYVDKLVEETWNENN